MHKEKHCTLCLPCLKGGRTKLCLVEGYSNLHKSYFCQPAKKLVQTKGSRDRSLHDGHSVPQIRTNFILVILRESLYQPKALVTGEPTSGERPRGRNT